MQFYAFICIHVHICSPSVYIDYVNIMHVSAYICTAHFADKLLPTRDRHSQQRKTGKEWVVKTVRRLSGLREVGEARRCGGGSPRSSGETSPSGEAAEGEASLRLRRWAAGEGREAARGLRTPVTVTVTIQLMFNLKLCHF